MVLKWNKTNIFARQKCYIFIRNYNHGLKLVLAEYLRRLSWPHRIRSVQFFNFMADIHTYKIRMSNVVFVTIKNDLDFSTTSRQMMKSKGNLAINLPLNVWKRQTNWEAHLISVYRIEISRKYRIESWE